jgi:predicted ATPase
MASEMAARAAEGGAIVLWGTTPKEGCEPYAPFALALKGLTARLSPTDLRALLGTAAPELGQLVPAVDHVLGLQRQTAHPPDRRHLFPAVAGLFQTLTKHTPVVLVLDDLDRADTFSLELLHSLTRVVTAVPLLLLGTSTADGTVSPAYIDIERVAQTVDLEHLDIEETAHIVQASLVGKSHRNVHEAIYAVSRGNPALTIEAIHAFIGRGYIAQRDDSWYLRDGLTPVLTTIRLRARGIR